MPIFFWNRTLKNTSDRQLSVRFEIQKKIPNSPYPSGEAAAWRPLICYCPQGSWPGPMPPLPEEALQDILAQQQRGIKYTAGQFYTLAPAIRHRFK